MATASKGPTRAEFLEDLLQRNPTTTLKQAQAAWKEAGREGSISQSTFYNFKSTLNRQSSGGGEPGESAAVKAGSGAATRGPKAGKGARPAQATRAKPNGRVSTPGEDTGGSAREEDRSRVLDEVEDSIDELIFRLKSIGGKPEVLEALRRARRMLFHEHG